MKLIEALKKVKALEKKADDLRHKVRNHSAISSVQTPVYEKQGVQIGEWIQAHSDVLKEILKLRIAIQKTNLDTIVEIELGGNKVVKSIAEWIHRRRDLAGDELEMWKQLTDRGIVEGSTKSPSGDIIEIKIIRYYTPEERDRMKELFLSEPSIIDGRLEVINAVTDLLE